MNFTATEGIYFSLFGSFILLFAMPSYAHFDRTQAPIYLVTFTNASATDEDFQNYLQELEKNYASEIPMTVIFDARQARIPSWKHQQMQAAWLKEKRALIQQHCSGIAYVISNPIIRNVLKVILSLQSIPVSYIVTPHLEEALQWSQVQLNR